MRFEPFEKWVTLREAPDLHQDSDGILKAVSYSRRKAEPNTGRWYRVVEASAECPAYFGPEAPVLCNLSMLSDNFTIGEYNVSLMPFSQCAAIRIGTETMQHLNTRHPVLPVGDYVLCKDNDEKHAAILGMKRSSAILSPLSALERGQRTDEAYETHVDQHGWESANPNRPNDGVRLMFTEVAFVGPEVPLVRGLEPGDMVAFRAQCSGIKFDLFGQSYRLVRCGEKNSEIVGRVPRKEFENS